jgi:hypothetical protein
MSIENFGEALPPVTRSAKVQQRKTTAPAVKKPLKFEIWYEKSSGQRFIMKAGDKNGTHLFEGTRDECLHKMCEQEELELLWADVKKRMNVTEDCLRSDSEEITNTTADVTPEMIMEHFSPRGIHFGEWMTQKDRQEALNKFWVAMWDLTEITGRNPWEWCEGLGISFGGRGQGKKANAHYEPKNHIINITKLSGAGALYHELWHSFDKDEWELPYLHNFEVRCRKADSTRSKKYFSTHREKMARAFENYCLVELGRKGLKQEYGVNVISPEQFSKDLGAYPYLLESEMGEICKFFDGIFGGKF